MGNTSSSESNSLSSYFVDFMNGGGCEESFTAVVDYFKDIEEDESEKDITKFNKVLKTLDKCIEDHSDYYKPIQLLLKAKETIKKETNEELKAAWRKRGNDPIDKDFDAFMKRGGCGESYMASRDCMEKNNEDRVKCVETLSKHSKCLYAHSDFYPTLSMETAKERFVKATKDHFG